MSSESSEIVTPERVNPWVREVAELVESSYSYWRMKRAGKLSDWDPPAGWDTQAIEWQNVQMLIAKRTAASCVDPESGSYPMPGPVGACGKCCYRQTSYCHAGLTAAIVPGTNEWSDWSLGNFDFDRQRVGGLPGRWRSGFTVAGDFVWSELQRACDRRDFLMVAGHSLGGAAAIAASAYGLRDGYASRMAGVFTFGAPRVTTVEGRDVLRKAYGPSIGQSFAHGFDIVPVSVLPFGWRHAFPRFYIGSDGTLRDKYPKWAEWKHATRRFWTGAIADHSMSTYLAWARSFHRPEAPPRC